MPCRRKTNEKNCGWWWESDLNRYGMVVSYPAHLLPSCTGLNGTRRVLVFLVFPAGLLTVRFLGFLGFAYAVSGCWNCFNRSCPKKLSPLTSKRSIFL